MMQMPRRTLVITLPPPSPDSTPFPITTTTTTNNNPPPSSSSDASPSIMITVLVLAIAVILSASLYLLLRFLRRHSSSSTTTPASLPHRRSNSSIRISPVERNPLIDSLPLFTYDSLSSKNPSAGGGDCAVCLSKFEPKDSLRLLPICCHAFHAECIDTWLSTNQSCPLCRSPLFLPESHLLSKFTSQNDSHSLSSSSRSFRVEIGNVSRRLPNSDDPARRTFSIGSNFEYIVGDDVSEVPFGSFRRPSDFKVDVVSADEQHQQQQQQGVLAAEVGTRGGWLKDYLSYSLSSTSSSRTTSFRGSGRWFSTGSSRRSAVEFPETRDSDLVVHAGLETSQFSDDIGELFRWLSGV